MKKTILLLLLLILSLTIVRGQANEKTKKKIEAARIALITERLDLSPEQAEKFWPVYKTYIKEKRVIQRGFKERLKGINPKNATEEETKKLLSLRLQMKQEELDLEKSYSNRLLGVISSQQLLSLRQAEQEFRKQIVEIIRRRQNNLRQGEQRRLQEERLRRRRGN